MDEYIKRSKAIDKLTLEYDYLTQYGRHYVDATKCMLEHIETEDVVEVVRCKDCRHGKSLDRTKPPFKYYKDCCVLCECEDVVGDEPMVYLPTHFCSYGTKMDGKGD